MSVIKHAIADMQRARELLLDSGPACGYLDDAIHSLQSYDPKIAFQQATLGFSNMIPILRDLTREWPDVSCQKGLVTPCGCHRCIIERGVELLHKLEHSIGPDEVGVEEIETKILKHVHLYYDHGQTWIEGTEDAAKAIHAMQLPRGITHSALWEFFVSNSGKVHSLVTNLQWDELATMICDALPHGAKSE